MRISEALDQYLVQLAADGRSRHTIKQAKRHVLLFAKWIGESEIASVTHERVAQFLASDVVRQRADGRPRKASSGNSLRSSLRAFFAYAHMSALAPSNAARLVRRAMCAPARPKALSDGDVAKLVTALDTAVTVAERRDRVMFMTMLRTGIRVGSTVGLDVGDVDLDESVLRLRRMKGGDEDVAFVPVDVVPLLREHIGARTSGPLFPARDGSRISTRVVGKRLELWAARAGLTRQFGPHALRHTFGQRVFDRTGDVLVTSRAMCHRSIASTAVYARPAESRVRAAMTR